MGYWVGMHVGTFSENVKSWVLYKADGSKWAENSDAEDLALNLYFNAENNEGGSVKLELKDENG